MIFLSGGPPHQDMVDLKPDAPVEIRGEFKPIRTNVPGIDICEHLPRLAAADGPAGDHPLRRRLRGAARRLPVHDGPDAGPAAAGRLAVARLAPWRSCKARSREAVPPFVGLSPKMKTVPWADPGQPGFLGPCARRRSSPTPTAWPT